MMFQQQADRPCDCGAVAKWYMQPDRLFCQSCRDKQPEGKYKKVSDYMLDKLQRKHGDPFDEMNRQKIKNSIRGLIGELEFLKNMHDSKKEREVKNQVKQQKVNEETKEQQKVEETKEQKQDLLEEKHQAEKPTESKQSPLLQPKQSSPTKTTDLDILVSEAKKATISQIHNQLIKSHLLSIIDQIDQTLKTPKKYPTFINKQLNVSDVDSIPENTTEILIKNCTCSYWKQFTDKLFEKCQNISQLHLQRCQLTDLTLLIFIDKLTNVKKLNLSYNRLKEIKVFQTLPKLEHLNLCSNMITTLHSIKMPNLRVMDLSMNRIQSMPLPESLANLEKLYLNNNHINNGNALFIFKYLPAKLIDLSENSINDQEKRILRSEYPMHIV